MSAQKTFRCFKHRFGRGKLSISLNFQNLTQVAHPVKSRILRIFSQFHSSRARDLTGSLLYFFKVSVKPSLLQLKLPKSRIFWSPGSLTKGGYCSKELHWLMKQSFSNLEADLSKNCAMKFVCHIFSYETQYHKGKSNILRVHTSLRLNILNRDL